MRAGQPLQLNLLTDDLLIGLVTKIAGQLVATPDGCWLWCGQTSHAADKQRAVPTMGWRAPDGGSTSRCVTRVCWALQNGSDPEGWLVSQCRVDRCVAPHHQQVCETVSETRRAIWAAIHESGILCHHGSLTVQQVRAIRETWWAGEATQKALGKRFGVCQVTISDVVRRHTYRGFPPGKVELRARKLMASGAVYRRGRERPRPLPEKERVKGLETGTGRFCDAQGVVYSTIREAEVATGVDRLEIARQANKHGIVRGDWFSYEAGEAPPVDLVCYAESPDWVAPKTKMRARKSQKRSTPRTVDAKG
jgi:hypothetical protein